jgi:ABC-2 type transport system ATP-binding protein
MSLIEVEGLSKFYGSHAAVRDVSFRINEGEIIGLLGLNGAGKSTILKILGSFLLPSAGRVIMGGNLLEDHLEKVRAMIGYLPDRPPLYEEMRVVSYLRFVARLKNVKTKDVDARVSEVITKTSLKDVMWDPIGELSQGFRQRVGIAQALIHNPPIIILDEPINGLDPIQIVEMRDVILSLKSKHTVILSSHILSEITKTCDRVLIIHQGELVAEGQESVLQQAHTKTMRISVQIRGNYPENAVASIMGLRVLSKDNIPDTDAINVKFECEGDLRGELASMLVKSGVTLLEIKKESDDLERLFMSLVKSSDAD